jgi:hypothetical protein
MIAVAGSAQSGTPDGLSNQKTPTSQLVADLQSLNTGCSLLLQQPSPSFGSATAPAPPAASTTTSAAKLAVENAKYKADVTRANLDAARQCKCDRLVLIFRRELTVRI